MSKRLYLVLLGPLLFTGYSANAHGPKDWKLPSEPFGENFTWEQTGNALYAKKLAHSIGALIYNRPNKCYAFEVSVTIPSFRGSSGLLTACPFEYHSVENCILLQIGRNQKDGKIDMDLVHLGRKKNFWNWLKRERIDIPTGSYRMKLRVGPQGSHAKVTGYLNDKKVISAETHIDTDILELYSGLFTNNSDAIYQDFRSICSADEE